MTDIPIETLEIVRDRFLIRLRVHINSMPVQTRGAFNDCVAKAAGDIADEFNERAAMFCMVFARTIIDQMDAAT